MTRAPFGFTKGDLSREHLSCSLGKTTCIICEAPTPAKGKAKGPAKGPGKGPPAACQTLLSFEVVLLGEVSKAIQLKMTDYTAVYRKVRTASLKLVELLCFHMLETVLRELES